VPEFGSGTCADSSHDQLHFPNVEMHTPVFWFQRN
jgi:hypothetical protein